MNIHDEFIRDSGGTDENTFFHDVLTNGLGAIAFFAILLLVLINKPGQENVAGSTLPGNILVEVFWPDKQDADVDAWVVGPEGPPVGYSNKGGKHYNLLRDDLGSDHDRDPVNYELVTSRGIPPGGHCVNVHLYGNASGAFPVPVKVSVKVQPDNPGSSPTKVQAAPILTSNVELRAVGQEINVFCFLLNEEGQYVKEKTFSDKHVLLRSPSAKNPWK